MNLSCYNIHRCGNVTRTFFFFYTMGEQVLPDRVGTTGREEVEKGRGRVNIVQIHYTHVCKWKNETC
jgi:hypothetical protein